MSPQKSGKDFSVVLEKVGNQPLMTTKILMQGTGLGLSDAKKLVDNAPSTVVSGLDAKAAVKLKEQLAAVGNVVSVPGLETETDKLPDDKIAVGKKAAKEPKNVKLMSSELEDALFKVYGIVGRDEFLNGERVCNLLSDLVPKLEKERRRVKVAYSANAVSVLINETDKTFAVNEAVKRIVDFSDMEESVARATVLTVFKVLK